MCHMNRMGYGVVWVVPSLVGRSRLVCTVGFRSLSPACAPGIKISLPFGGLAHSGRNELNEEPRAQREHGSETESYLNKGPFEIRGRDEAMPRMACASASVGPRRSTGLRGATYQPLVTRALAIA